MLCDLVNQCTDGVLQGLWGGALAHHGEDFTVLEF